MCRSLSLVASHILAIDGSQRPSLVLWKTSSSADRTSFSYGLSLGSA
jgi:hypothetical protein